MPSSMTPEQMFGMLNSIFSAFDDLCEHYGLEKIKTIGDAYMAAGGINSASSDPAVAIADFALALQAVLQRDYQINAAHMELRIGISTGPVVAGVVGKHKFIYDIWGDTVNLASRITGEGMPGTIHCDTATQQRLAASFDFAAPRRIQLKGTGEVIVHRLLGRKSGG
jgi:class 3 adenylate cyclase